jgi:hypothetical protein
MTRAYLIKLLAEDISCGYPSRYDSAYFLDTLLDDRRVTAAQVAILLNLDERNDTRIDVADRIRELVKSEAVKFFSDDERGKQHVSDLLAEQERDRAADEECARRSA